jgi:hypothetical protein
LKSRLVALLPLAFLLSAALAGAGLVVHQAAKLFAGSSPEEKWNLGDLGLCRAEGASCHVWDCCGVNGELKPMWCNPFASGQIGSIGKARCVVCEEGVETGSKEFPGTLVACDATQLNALGKDGGDKVALQAAQIAANLEADRIKSSMAYVPADDARVR